MSQQYTVGFAHHAGHVLLIHKIRGPAARGRHNGVGGKVEPGETPRACQRREFREETGLDIAEDRWNHTVTLYHPAWRVFFYKVLLTEEEIKAARTVEDEQVGLFDLLDLPDNVVPNLRWLVPLSMDSDLKFPITIEDLKG